MNVVGIIQARTGSTRLPGKVLADIAGRPMLDFQLARLRGFTAGPVVVATTTKARDDPVVQVAEAAGAAVFRGSETDVLSRFAGALAAHRADVVVRLTADCPLVDPAVVQAAVELQEATGASLVTNGIVRTFPVGLDVEVVTATALRTAEANATDPVEREHVTPFIHRRPDSFLLRSLRTTELLGDERWTVDTAEDLDRVRRIVARLTDPLTAGWREIVDAAGLQAAPGPGALWVRPAVAGDGATLDRRSDATGAIGTGEAGQPVSTHLEDPSVRTWIGEVDGAAVGWAQVQVRTGVGHLTGRAQPEWASALEAGVRRALRADQQVTEIVGAAWPAEWRASDG